MAIREVFTFEDPQLHRNCHAVTNFDDRLANLLTDMADTMYEQNGVGLAAPQVGIIRRACVVDVGEGLYEFINPVITYKSADLIEEDEGCLSFPGQWGKVKRPQKIKVEYFDRFGKKQELEAENLFARAICHETDHLNGTVFKDIATRMLTQEEIDEKFSDETEEEN